MTSRALSTVCFGLIVAIGIQAVGIRRAASAQSVPHRVRLAPRLEDTSKSESRWYPSPLKTLVGTVQQFDGDQIAVLVDGESVPTRFASQRVMQVELTTTPDDQQQALALLRQKQYRAALPALVQSISEHDASTRPPVWRQQWLSMLAAQAAMRSGRGEIALELVGQLDSRPLPAMVLAMLPIDWTGDSDDQSLLDFAVKRASSDSLAVKLVAASWLLRSPKYRAAAESALQRLSAQTERKWIAAFARQQLWRTKTPPEMESRLKQWEDEINAMPMVLRTGPMVSVLNLTRQAGLKDAERKWALTLELAAPTWHPDLPASPNDN